MSAETEQGLLLRYIAGAVFVPPVFCRTLSPLGMAPQRPVLPVKAHQLLTHHTVSYEIRKSTWMCAREAGPLSSCHASLCISEK